MSLMVQVTAGICGGLASAETSKTRASQDCSAYSILMYLDVSCILLALLNEIQVYIERSDNTVHFLANIQSMLDCSKSVVGLCLV